MPSSGRVGAGPGAAGPTSAPGQAAARSPDTHTWTRREAVGQVTGNTHRPPDRQDSQTGHVGAMPRHNRGTTHSHGGSGPAGAWRNRPHCPSVWHHLLPWRCSLPIALYGSPLPYLSKASHLLCRGPLLQRRKSSLASASGIALSTLACLDALSGRRCILTGRAYSFSREGVLPPPPSVPRHCLDCLCPLTCPVLRH